MRYGSIVGSDGGMGLIQIANKLKSGEKQTSLQKKGSAPPKEKPAIDNAIKGTKWLLSSLNNQSVLKNSSITSTFADGSDRVTQMFCEKPEGIMRRSGE